MRVGMPRSLGFASGVIGLLLAGAAPALADPATPTNYRSEVTRVEGAGVSRVEIIGGDAFVRLTAAPGVTVELLGYEGEEYIRFESDGVVRVNRRSPATYLNDDRYARVTLPFDADASAPPEWETVSVTGTYSWHDHRTHWMSPKPPAVVIETDGAETTPIFEWTLPFRSDHEPGRIVGVLSWTPSMSPAPWYTMATIAFLAFGVTACRLRSSAPAMLLLGLSVAATLAGLATTVSQVSEGRTVGVDLLGPVVVLVVSALALAEDRRSARGGTRIVLIGSIGLAIWAVLRIDVLTFPILPTVLPHGVDRALTAIVLGGAVGLTVGSASRIIIENRAVRRTQPETGPDGSER
jgi:hypothetical protein